MHANIAGAVGGPGLTNGWLICRRISQAFYDVSPAILSANAAPR